MKIRLLFSVWSLNVHVQPKLGKIIYAKGNSFWNLLLKSFGTKFDEVVK